jgi:hypothetical protein
MRFYNYLNEEYVTSIDATERYGERYAEIFNFPSTKELTQFREVRFIIDITNKKFYVWEGFKSKVFHSHVEKFLNIPIAHLEGLGSVKGNKIIIEGGWDNICAPPPVKNNIRHLLKGDFLKKILRYFTFKSEDEFYDSIILW